MSLPNTFNPRANPELALQTYTFFGGDPGRADAKIAFANGQSTHLSMNYPLLTHERIDPLITKLVDKSAQAEELYGPDSVTAQSVRYRLEEACFLGHAVELNADPEGSASTDFVSLNDLLYGKPEQDQVADIWADILYAYLDTSDPRIKDLWAELKDGFTVELGSGDTVHVPGLTGYLTSDTRRSETLTDAARLLLAQEWKLFAGPVAEAQALLADIIASESGLDDTYDPAEIVFSGQRLFQAFQLGAITVAELTGLEPFGVELDPTGSSASWETSKHAVIVGQHRSKAGGKYPTVSGVMPHECMHAVKASCGALSSEPALATGVFTRDEKGAWVSYLDFEEGNNMLGEEVLCKRKDASPVLSGGFELLSDLVYHAGLNDRQAFEVYRRLRAIELLFQTPDMELSAALERASQIAATKVERLFRGTPVPQEPRTAGHMPIYTKDLAYSKGYRKAVSFWNRAAAMALATDHPQSYIHEVFEKQSHGKIDPTVPEQAKLVGL